MLEIPPLHLHLTLCCHKHQNAPHGGLLEQRSCLALARNTLADFTSLPRYPEAEHMWPVCASVLRLGFLWFQVGSSSISGAGIIILFVHDDDDDDDDSTATGWGHDRLSLRLSAVMHQDGRTFLTHFNFFCLNLSVYSFDYQMISFCPLSTKHLSDFETLWAAGNSIFSIIFPSTIMEDNCQGRCKRSLKKSLLH